jgi:cytochrome-b5 reductase
VEDKVADKDILIPYKLIDIKQVTHDTKQFSFLIPAGAIFEHLPGDFMRVFPNFKDELEYRTYTPTTTPETKDHFEYIIKRYPNGQVSRFMHERQVGDEVWMSGPHTGGHFVEGMATKVGMVAGGTGITPMIAIVRSILNQAIKTEISLVFSNKTIDDIILKDEFDDYAKRYPHFKRYYVVDQAPADWSMGIGRINEGILKDRLPEASESTTIFVCGPPMMQIELRKKLIAMGHRKDKIIIP